MQSSIWMHFQVNQSIKIDFNFHFCISTIHNFVHFLSTFAPTQVTMVLIMYWMWWLTFWSKKPDLHFLLLLLLQMLPIKNDNRQSLIMLIIDLVWNHRYHYKIHTTLAATTPTMIITTNLLGMASKTKLHHFIVRTVSATVRQTSIPESIHPILVMKRKTNPVTNVLKNSTAKVWAIKNFACCHHFFFVSISSFFWLPINS